MKNATLILSARTRNALYHHVLTLDPDKVWKFGSDPNPKIVAKYTSRELMRSNNFGRVSLAEVIGWLEEFELKLADDPAASRCPTCGQILRTYR